MSFWNHFISIFRRKTLSDQRRGLLTSIMEGIPANIIGNLLGGPILTILRRLSWRDGSQDVGLACAIPALAKYGSACSGILYAAIYQSAAAAYWYLPLSHRMPHGWRRA